MDFLFGDLETLIRAIGLLGIFVIVFAESGLFLGFFLPGDSLLFTAGFLASQGFLDITALVLITFGGAVLGDNFGYAFGKKVGPALFTKEDSILFKKSHLERARVFYEKYGTKTVLFARFFPMVRTFAPILAGVGKMKYPVFVFYNLIGGAVWGIGFPLVGYTLGRSVPGIDRYILLLTAAIIMVSFIPLAFHILKNRENRKRLLEFIKTPPRKI